MKMQSPSNDFLPSCLGKKNTYKKRLYNISFVMNALVTPKRYLLKEHRKIKCTHSISKANHNVQSKWKLKDHIWNI